MALQRQRQRLDLEQMGDVTVVSLKDRKILLEEQIQAVGEQLMSLANESGPVQLLLNFRNVEYMSSAVLGMLDTFNKKIKAGGGKLVLCNIDPQIREVFAITKLDKLFVISDQEQEVDSLRAYVAGAA